MLRLPRSEKMTQTFYQQMTAVIQTDDPKQIADFIRADESRLYTDSGFGTCLQYAAKEGCSNAVECLLELGADINTRVGFLERSALEEASDGGHIDIVEYLLAKGAKLEVGLPNHNPLFHAIYENHIEVAKVLLSAGLDPHVTYLTLSGKLRNAFSFAKECGKGKVIDLLTAVGCRMPVEGVDIPVNEAEVQAEMQATIVETVEDEWDEDKIAEHSSDEQEIIAYVSQRFGPTDELALREILPVLKNVHVAIHVIRPTGQHPFMTLFTTGMSSRAMNVPAGQEAYSFGELVMHLPMHLPMTWLHPLDARSDDNASLWPVQVLRQAAYLPHVTDTWYGPCHTAAFADPPQPLGLNVPQTSVLLLADKLLPLQLGSGKSVKFFTVLPIYTEELDVVARLGVAELLDRFQKHLVTPLVEPERINVGLK